MPEVGRSFPSFFLVRFSEQEKLVDEIKLKHVKNFELEVRLEQATKEGTKHQAEVRPTAAGGSPLWHF